MSDLKKNANITEVFELQKSEDDLFDKYLCQIAASPIEESSLINDELIIGHTLGHFLVEELIGIGGMGVVYRAKDIRLRRFVALKVLPSKLSSDPMRRDLLLREAQSAAQINHPNIAAVYYVGESDGRNFIAMEFIKGKTIRELIPPGGLGWVRSVYYGKQIAAGLAAAHEHEIIHRDLKPENIMVDENNIAKILDFGIAKQQSIPLSVKNLDLQSNSSIFTAGLVGTAAYMAPEQIEGITNKRSDIYSFGIMLYEIATNERHKSYNASILSSEFPKDFNLLIEKCTSPNPEERFLDGSDVLNFLSKITSRERQKKINIFSNKIFFFFFFLILLFIAAYNFFSSNPRNKHSTFHKSMATIKQLTHFSTEKPITSAALSPSGEFIAYMLDYEAYTYNLHLNTHKKINTSLNNLEFIADWFPDNDHIVVFRQGKGESLELWKICISSGESTRISWLPECISEKPVNYFGVNVSRNGKKLAVSTKKLIQVCSTTGGVCEVILDYSNVPELIIKHNIQLSPDDRFVIFSQSNNKNGDYKVSINIINILTKKISHLFSSADLLQETGYVPFTLTPDWRLFFVRSHQKANNKNYGIWSLQINKQNGTPKSELKRVAVNPEFEIDSMQVNLSGSIVSLVGSKVQEDVYVGDYIKKEKLIKYFHRVTFTDTNEKVSDFSSDNKGILTSRIFGTKSECYYQSLKSNLSVSLMNNSKNCYWPLSLSSSDQYLFWTNKTPKQPRLFLKPNNKEDSIELFSIIDNNFSFGYDGNYWVQCATSKKICLLSKVFNNSLYFYKIDVVDRKVTFSGKLNAEWRNHYHWALSGDGKRIAILHSSRNRIGIFTISGSFVSEIPLQNNFIVQYIAWHPNENFFIATGYMPEDRLNFYQIVKIDYDGRQTSLWTTSFAWINTPVFSSDGKNLAVSLLKLNSNIWLLKGF